MHPAEGPQRSPLGPVRAQPQSPCGASAFSLRSVNLNIVRLVELSIQIAIVAVGAALLLRAWIRLLKRRAHAEGTIERIAPGITRRSHVGGGPPAWRTSTHTATVCFDVLERSYRFDHEYWPSMTRLKVGNRLPVLYDPDNPMNAAVDAGERRFAEVTVFTVLLLLFIVLTTFF